MIKYNHEDWVSFKRYYNFTNQDIATLLGLTYHSVKNQTAPSKPLPKWALALIYGADLAFKHDLEMRRYPDYPHGYVRKNCPDFETLKGFTKNKQSG